MFLLERENQKEKYCIYKVTRIIYSETDPNKVTVEFDNGKSLDMTVSELQAMENAMNEDLSLEQRNTEAIEDIRDALNKNNELLNQILEELKKIK